MIKLTISNDVTGKVNTYDLTEETARDALLILAENTGDNELAEAAMAAHFNFLFIAPVKRVFTTGRWSIKLETEKGE